MSQTEVKAIAKGIRISPRKVGVVVALIRRRTVTDALVILENTQRKAARPVAKLINSAVANARNNLRMPTADINSLEIKSIMVTEGSSMKRYKFVGHGRRAKPRPMLKRSSHITVVLSTPTTATTTSVPAKRGPPKILNIGNGTATRILPTLSETAIYSSNAIKNSARR